MWTYQVIYRFRRRVLPGWDDIRTIRFMAIFPNWNPVPSEEDYAENWRAPGEVLPIGRACSSSELTDLDLPFDENRPGGGGCSRTPACGCCEPMEVDEEL